MNQYFIENEADALARKALEFFTKGMARGDKTTPGKAFTSASRAIMRKRNFQDYTKQLIKKRARAILAKLLRTK